ncbi:hypothetical protein ATM97_09475 [Nocardia sp. MH4]|nr:hypothetical protein [Nocardia sp. MH4]
MVVGWGVSLGARNTVCVAVGGGDPVVRRDRTTSHDGRILGFADLTVAGGLPQEPPAEELVVRVLGATMAAHGAVAEHTVLAHPAVYSERHLAALRRELGRARLGEVALVAEPIAAAAALDRPDENVDAATDVAALLVYDLGATSLDLTVVVRDRRGHRIAGRPARSYAFGGRSTAAALAIAEHDLAGAMEPGAGELGAMEPDATELAAAELGAAEPGAMELGAAEPGAMELGAMDLGAGSDPRRAIAVRAQLVRDSLPLVHECLRTAGLSVARLDAVLLVGGAATPDDVARTLAGALRCPVVREREPGTSIARGAALLGARRSATGTVLVPVRRPVSRGAFVAAAVAVPLLFSVALGLLRADDGRGGAMVAVPGRALPGERVDAIPGSVLVDALPATLWAGAAMRPIGSIRAQPDRTVADPSVASPMPGPSSGYAATTESSGFVESSASVPVTYSPTAPDSAAPGPGLPAAPAPLTLTLEIPAPPETPDSPVDPGHGVPIDYTPTSVPGEIPGQASVALPDSLAEVPPVPVATAPEPGASHP